MSKISIKNHVQKILLPIIICSVILSGALSSCSETPIAQSLLCKTARWIKKHPIATACLASAGIASYTYLYYKTSHKTVQPCDHVPRDTQQAQILADAKLYQNNETWGSDPKYDNRSTCAAQQIAKKNALQNTIYFSQEDQGFFAFTNYYSENITLKPLFTTEKTVHNKKTACHWKSVEHYFQAHKATNDTDFFAVLNQATPQDAKNYWKGKQIRSDWHTINQQTGLDVKTHIMLDALRHKFSQNPHLQQMLLDTGDAILVEDTAQTSYEDYFWGNGHNGMGWNHLGQLLMHVRNELQASLQNAHTYICLNYKPKKPSDYTKGTIQQLHSNFATQEKNETTDSAENIYPSAVITDIITPRAQAIEKLQKHIPENSVQQHALAAALQGQNFETWGGYGQQNSSLQGLTQSIIMPNAIYLRSDDTTYSSLWNEYHLPGHYLFNSQDQGITYSWISAEHYFQTCKAASKNDACAMLTCTTPQAIQQLMSTIKTRADWFEFNKAFGMPNNIVAMVYANYCKFKNNQSLREFLLKTGNSIIINDTSTLPHEEYFWGNGHNSMGWNHFGQILMYVRFLLKSNLTPDQYKYQPQKPSHYQKLEY